MGQQMIPQLQQEYGQLTSDPGAIYNQMVSGYTQSPGYQYQYGQSQKAANQASAAGGMAGTPASQTSAAQAAENVSSGDFNNYMSSLMGLYGQGLSGQQGLETQGYGAAGQITQGLTSYEESQAQMAAAQAQSQQNKGAGFLGTVGALAGFIPGI